MRKSVIKNILLSICFAVFMFASMLGVAFSGMLPHKKASAESNWQTEGVFEMDDGASLKLGTVGGLRFVVRMDEEIATFVKETEDAELGFVIAPKDLILAANGDYLNMKKKIGGKVDKAKIYQDDNYWFANGCIANIKAANLTRSFTAIAYIQYNGEVRYTEYNDLARNNLYDTVNAAVLSGLYTEELFGEYKAGGYVQNGENQGWYGSEQYPIVVEDGAEYTALVETVNKSNVDFSDYYVAVRNEATSEKVFANTETAPTIVSGELDEVNKLIVGLPDSVTMPDAIGMIGRIREVEKKYNALSAENKASVKNYAKVEALLTAIEGYDRVYQNGESDGTVIPSYVPNCTSTIGGSATTREDDVYGNVLTVKSDANGKAALSFENFPSVEAYTHVYFYVKISVGCNIYLSDGITNDGWGENWMNTWSTSGFLCNANTWRLIEIDVANDGYIGTNFAFGFRTDTTGFTFEISDFYGYTDAAPEETSLMFGTQVDSGETNEYGKIYNISREQWYIDNNNVNTIGTLQANKLANALPSGYETFYFWMYNGTDTEYNFHLAGDVSGTWTDSADSVALKVGEWTKVTISAEDIALNKNGQWYVYILGGDGAGAAKDGWKISTIYAGPYEEYSYTDHADVKNTIALIDAIPATVTLADKAAVEAARAAYDALTATQQNMVTNLSTLAAAENTIAAIEEANEVVALINAINPVVVDEVLVEEAREKYNALSDEAKGYVTNLSTLEKYEAAIKAEKDLQAAVDNVYTLIANLPDSVLMPDHLVFVTRIEKAKDAYNALTSEGKGMVKNYEKLKTLVVAIKGYETVHAQSIEGVDVVPSHVPNCTSTIGGTATLGYDSYYGDYLKVTPNAGGKVAIQFKNFPDVSGYLKIYFNIRVVGESCNIYLSDGTTNDGWGENWKNTWSMSGFEANNGYWIQKEVDPSTGIFSSNWALGLRTNTTDVSFEITNIIGVKPNLGEATDVQFGTFTDSGTKNVYGTVYNLAQGWSSDISLGAFNANVLQSNLKNGHDTLHFWIYNPNDSDLTSWVEETTNWSKVADLETLKAKTWTEVIINPQLIEANKTMGLCVNVSSGANTSGWQISPIYSFSSQEELLNAAVLQVQAAIDALDVGSIDADKLQAARVAYEELSEAEKELIIIDNLIACEEAYDGITQDLVNYDENVTYYKLYIDQTGDTAMNKAIEKAASFIQEYLALSTGVSFEIVDDKPTTMTKYSYAIVLGYNDLYESVCLGTPLTENNSGYVIKGTGERAVFIQASRPDGYHMAALAFLREVMGYEMFAEDCVVYEDAIDDISVLDIKETPTFAYRQRQTYMTDSEVYGMGLQSNTDIWVHSLKGWDMHNTLHYLPTETYQSAHPDWYYTYTDSTNEERTQICPTAGGSSAEFNAMVEAIAANMLVQINAQPEKENISFSIMDTGDGDDCQCARCTLYDTLYGEGGFAAAWIDLMNAVNAKVRESLPADKVLNIAFLAYRGTEKAPANIDASGNVTLMKRYDIADNGSYTQTSEDLKCDEGVTVWLAPIHGLYAENLNHADNAETLATVKKWCAISESVYVWAYGTNFKFYMYPYNSWQASAENYKILADLGVKAVWSQSNETEATAFSDLKGYIDSKFMFNVNADYEEVLDSYFTNYFGAGAEKMRALFDKIVAKCEEIEANYDGLGRGIYDELENTSGFLGIGAKTYWAKDWLDECVTLCNDAKAAVDADGSLTEEQKTAIKNRITKESLFPRYVLCTTFANKYSSSAKKEMRQAFKADATALGMTLYREANGLLSNLYSDWGV